jgi:hypothetical protein
VGHNIVFYLLRYQIRREVKTMMIQNKFHFPLTIITLKNNQLKSGMLEWENDQEFRFHDKMYDILKIQKAGDVTTLYCLNDKKEELLIKTFLFSVSKKDNQSDKAVPLVIQLLKFLGHYFLISISNKIISPSFIGIFYNSFSLKINRIYLSIYPPPPQYY